MNEEALRTLVRETIARLGTRADSAAAPDPSTPLSVGPHPSHYKYNLTQSDGPCLIEPGVPCNHCGYCQSHGH